MALCFVEFEQRLYLQIQGLICKAEPFGQILVYSALADSEALGGFTDGGFVLNYVVSKLSGSLIYAFTHKTPLPAFFTMLIYIHTCVKI